MDSHNQRTIEALNRRWRREDERRWPKWRKEQAADDRAAERERKKQAAASARAEREQKKQERAQQVAYQLALRQDQRAQHLVLKQDQRAQQRGLKQLRQEQTKQAHEQNVQRLINCAISLSDLLDLSPPEFELKIVDLLKRRGFRNVLHTGGARDLNADIACIDPDGSTLIVQCKRHAVDKRIGSPVIQSFIGMACAHHRSQRGMLVTTASFTPDARALAKEHHIVLVDGEELVQWLAETAEPRSP